MDTAVTQIRDVTKWLIAAFAAVGVALAAGSQLSEIGVLSGWRLVAAFVAVLFTLGAIAAAILYATRVLTPSAISLDGLVADEERSKIGKEIRAHPSFLLGHGETIKGFSESGPRCWRPRTRPGPSTKVPPKRPRKSYGRRSKGRAPSDDGSTRRWDG